MLRPEIYFHVGLGKVASTYLQKAFFPKLEDIYYLPTNQYHRFQEIIDRGEHARYFVSREFDNQLEYELARFTKVYPQTKVIIAFRRQDGWMASQYRRYVKNGGYRSFSEFFDVEHNTGLWKTDQALFMPKIEIVERYTRETPLVLLHEDLKKDTYAFLDQIAQYSKSTYSKASVSTKAVHTSYTDKQLKFIRSVAKRFFTEPRYDNMKAERGLLHWIKRRSKMLTCYATMYSSIFLPESMIGKAPLIAPNDLEKVRDFYEKDWAALQNYARKIAL